ncbi:MAG: PAAR domain-containing protein, partial [Azoarcus sp.]|nr:PAAR domain-containing protein [Azoarcus sp.]
MVQRRFILLGDKTSHGGTVVGARGAGRVPFYIDGKPVACVGDPVVCPRCKGVHYILEGADNPPMYLDGYLIATEHCMVSDDSFLMSIQQFHATYDDGGDAVRPVAALVASATAGISAEEAAMLANATQGTAPLEDHSLVELDYRIALQSGGNHLLTPLEIPD